jgi:hypothetical protein
MRHECSDRPASPRQPLPIRCSRDLENLAGLFARQLEDLAEDVRDPMRSVEALQHRLRAPDHHFFLEKTLIGLRGLGSSHLQAVQQIPLHIRERQRLPFDSRSANIEQMIRRDPQYPGTEAAFPPERSERGDDPEQDLLRGVFRVLRMPKHAHGKTVYPVLDTAQQLIQRRDVSRTRGRNQTGEYITRLGGWLAGFLRSHVTET